MHTSLKRILRKKLFHGAEIITESRTSLRYDSVCALLSFKLNCDRIAAGFKLSKVQLNAAK